MQYRLDWSSLLSRVEEEMSHIADASYAETGQSLYDTIVITEKDRDGVRRLLADAVDSFISRVFDICSYSQDTLRFTVPDYDYSMSAPTWRQIEDFIVYYAVTTLCRSRKAERAEEFASRAQEALTKAVTLLKSRKHPQ